MQSTRIPVAGGKTDPLYSHLSKPEPRRETAAARQGSGKNCFVWSFCFVFRGAKTFNVASRLLGNGVGSMAPLSGLVSPVCRPVCLQRPHVAAAKRAKRGSIRHQDEAEAATPEWTNRAGHNTLNSFKSKLKSQIHAVAG